MEVKGGVMAVKEDGTKVKERVVIAEEAVKVKDEVERGLKRLRQLRRR